MCKIGSPLLSFLSCSLCTLLQPRIYNQILGTPINYINNSSKAYEWQRKLSDTKSEFANSILYKLLVEDKDIPILPQYLQDALEYIKNAIKGGR